MLLFKKTKKPNRIWWMISQIFICKCVWNKGEADLYFASSDTIKASGEVTSWPIIFFKKLCRRTLKRTDPSWASASGPRPGETKPESSISISLFVTLKWYLINNCRRNKAAFLGTSGLVELSVREKVHSVVCNWVWIWQRGVHFRGSIIKLGSERSWIQKLQNSREIMGPFL